MALSEALIQSTVRHQVYLERLKAGEVNQFAAFLKEIDKDLRDRLTKDDLTQFSRARLEKLLTAVDQSLADIFNRYYDDLSGRLLDLAEYEAEFESRNLNHVIQEAGFETVIPAPNQVRAAVLSSPLSVRGADGGKLLEPFVQDWSHVERKRITGAIRQGAFEGQTNFQIIQALRGTKANRFTDGLLATTSRNADAIVRTAVQHIASTARHETWSANEDIVVGYRWVSTLDGRTSTQCRSLDGKVFELGKGPRPPIHIRCRSTTVAELSSEFDFLKEGRTRASQNGPVSADQSYYDWLKQQAAEFQDDAIGATRAALLRDGGLSAEQFAKLNLGRNFKPMTLAQMRHKEPVAFKKMEAAADLTKTAQNAKLADSAQRRALTNNWMTEKEYQVEVGRMANPRIKKLADEYGLTQAEQVALGHYTGTGYFDLNHAIWDGDHSYDDAVDVLRDSLRKLPEYKGVTVRRTQLPPEFLAKHEVGTVVDYNAFTSSTYGIKDVMDEYPHRVVIHSLTGKKIDWISHFPDEKEVLYTSPTRFDVVDRYEEGGLIHIELWELPDE